MDQDPQRAPTDQELELLSQEMPALARLRDFARLAESVQWFSDLGTPLRKSVREIARAYLDGLGFPDVHMARLHSWEEAAAAGESLDWDTEGWEAEEGLRAALTTDALEQLSQEALEVGLAYLFSAIEDPIRQAVLTAAAIWGEDDEELLAAAMGSALQSAHCAALAVVAGEDDETHPFIHRFRLFERGRWPVSLAGRTYNIF